MKVSMSLGLLGLLLSQSVAVMAASDFAPATIQPSLPVDTRCSISVGAAVIDYGSQSRGQLQRAGSKQILTLGKRTMILSVACPYSQAMRLTLRGAQAANGDLRHGDRGSTRIYVMDAQVDGRAVQLTSATSDGVLEGGAASSLQLQPGKSFSATQNGHFMKGKTFSARIEVEPVFPESATRVSARQVDESFMTLELME